MSSRIKLFLVMTTSRYSLGTTSVPSSATLLRVEERIEISPARLARLRIDCRERLDGRRGLGLTNILAHERPFGLIPGLQAAMEMA